MLSRDQFECIEQEELIFIFKRILNRILDGKINEEIRIDEIVWFNLNVYEYFNVYKYNNFKDIVEQINIKIDKIKV